MRLAPALILASVLLAAVVAPGINRAVRAQSADNVLAFHNGADRGGNYTVPGLTWERGRSVHVDEQFHGSVSGNVYAQPLYWRPPGSRSGMLVVATEANNVQALDAVSGDEIWRQSLGAPVRRSLLQCGNINPLGITGTPIIDAEKRAIYLDAAVESSSAPRHLAVALSLENGSVLPGWPVDIADALKTQRPRFDPRDQNERGALTSLDGNLYIPFGGHLGDCGDYRGWVVGISLADSHKFVSWSTRGRGGGIWAPGGISAAGQSLFAATGNTLGVSTWSDGEAVVRLGRDLHRSSDQRDYFAPADWRTLDREDADLGATNPAIVDVESQGGRQGFIVALGKDGRAYLLDRDNLGGIGGSLAVETVSKQPIVTAPAVYSNGPGETFVALKGRGARCPSPASDGELIVLKVAGGAQPSVSTAWCGNIRGAGSPIVTTSDGHSDPIVWMLGAEGDNRLHGFRGDNGEPLFSGGKGPAMAGLHAFQTLIATKDRLYVGADGRVYAFAF
jgi:outer membrane protein assembly factor BamB